MLDYQRVIQEELSNSELTPGSLNQNWPLDPLNRRIHRIIHVESMAPLKWFSGEELGKKNS